MFCWHQTPHTQIWQTRGTNLCQASRVLTQLMLGIGVSTSSWLVWTGQGFLVQCSLLARLWIWSEDLRIIPAAAIHCTGTAMGMDKEQLATSWMAEAAYFLEILWFWGPSGPSQAATHKSKMVFSSTSCEIKKPPLGGEHLFMSSLLHDFTSWSSLNLLKWSALKVTHNPIDQGLGKGTVKFQFLITFPLRNQPIFRFHRTITEMKDKFTDYTLDNPQQFSFHHLNLATPSRGWISNANFDAALLISRFSIPAKCHLCTSKTCKSR